MNFLIKVATKWQAIMYVVLLQSQAIIKKKKIESFISSFRSFHNVFQDDHTVFPMFSY
jgi:hypothetical protein